MPTYPRRQDITKQHKKAFWSPFETVATEAVPSEFWGAPVLEAADGTLYCPGFTGDTYSKNVWDTVVLGIPYDLSAGEEPKTPGLCEVVVSKGRTVDKKKSSGSDGERLTFTGINNAEGEIRVTIWTPEQLVQLQNLWYLLFPPPQIGSSTARTDAGKGTKKFLVQPYDIYHPTLQMHRVSRVVFMHGEGLGNGPVVGSKTFVMRWVEFLDPGTVTVTTTPKAAQAIGSALDADYQPPSKNGGTDP